MIFFKTTRKGNIHYGTFTLKYYLSLACVFITTDLSFLPVKHEELSAGFVQSHALHPPHGPSLSVSCFLRQPAVLSNQLLPTILKQEQNAEANPFNRRSYPGAGLEMKQMD